jgi:hypothetical protein
MLSWQSRERQRERERSTKNSLLVDNLEIKCCILRVASLTSYQQLKRFSKVKLGALFTCHMQVISLSTSFEDQSY